MKRRSRITHRPRIEIKDPSKSIERLLLDKVLTLIVVSLPIAGFALWGNMQLAYWNEINRRSIIEYEAKRQDFLEKQSVRNRLHDEFVDTIGVHRLAYLRLLSLNRPIDLSMAADSQYRQQVLDRRNEFELTSNTVRTCLSKIASYAKAEGRNELAALAETRSLQLSRETDHILQMVIHVLSDDRTGVRKELVASITPPESEINDGDIQLMLLDPNFIPDKQTVLK